MNWLSNVKSTGIFPKIDDGEDISTPVKKKPWGVIKKDRDPN